MLDVCMFILFVSFRTLRIAVSADIAVVMLSTLVPTVIFTVPVRPKLVAVLHSSDVCDIQVVCSHAVPANRACSVYPNEAIVQIMRLTALSDVFLFLLSRTKLSVPSEPLEMVDVFPAETLQRVPVHPTSRTQV